MPTPPHHPASQSPSTPRSQHPTSPEITTRYSPKVVKRMQGDTCYRCNQIGHWSWDCPLTPPNNNNSSSRRLSPSPKTDSPLNPTKIFCRCGHGFCVVKTSRSENNPGSKYYACPIKRGKECRSFVQWCDRPVDESYLQPPPYKYPECECGAGVCQKVEDPDAADKDCFVCPVRKDHGSCGYKVSEDELLDNSKSVVPFQPSSQKHYDLGEGGDFYVENSKRMRMMEDFETPLSTAASEHPKGDNATPEATPSRCGGFPEFEKEDDLQEVVNSVPWDAVEREAFLLSRRSTPSRISCRQNLFLAGAFNDASLGRRPTGWLGRLLHLQPTRSLKFPAPQASFCCIFPSFVLIAVPKQAITFDDHCECNQQLAITNLSEHARLSSDGCHTEVFRDILGPSVVSRDVSVSPPSQSSQGGSKRKPMSKAERKRHAALGLQQDLLNDLDSLDPHDKESMRMAAEDTFLLLDGLSVDYKQFSEHVWDFINYASAIADINKSMENSLTFEEYNQCIEEERARLTQIQEDCGKTETLLDASNQRRQWLHEEVSRLEALLHERRDQLSSCEMESLKIESNLADLKRKMTEADRTLKGRTAEADLARKLNEERQTIQMAAKAALEKAKLELEK